MSENSTNANARLDNAERDIQRLRTDIGKLHEKSDAIIASLSKLREQQAVQHAHKESDLEMIRSRMCPKPGACVELVPRIEALENEFSKWHDTQQQLKGAVKTVRTFWLGVGSILTTAMWFAKEFFTLH